MKNYIAHNIKYLCSKYFLTQDELGSKVFLKKGVIGTYTRGKANPQIDTVQRICIEFNISIDDFINRKLDELPANDPGQLKMNHAQEPTQHEYSRQRDSVAGLIAAEVARQLEPSTRQINDIHEAIMILELQEGIAELKQLALQKKHEQQTKSASK